MACACQQTFYAFRGCVKLRGAFPKLVAIWDKAFNKDTGAGATTPSSFVARQGLPRLRQVGSKALEGFTGQIVLAGAYPKLAVIKDRAFYHSGAASSSIAFPTGLPALAEVGDLAFAGFGGTSFFGGGRGAYPLLVSPWCDAEHNLPDV